VIAIGGVRTTPWFEHVRKRSHRYSRSIVHYVDPDGVGIAVDLDAHFFDGIPKCVVQDGPEGAFQHCSVHSCAGVSGVAGHHHRLVRDGVGKSRGTERATSNASQRPAGAPVSVRAVARSVSRMSPISSALCRIEACPAASSSGSKAAPPVGQSRR
jgi:hypothetical protein